MMKCAVGNPATQQHTQGRHEQIGGQHDAGFGQRRIVGQVQYRHAELADAVAGHGNTGKEQQAHENRQAEQQSQSAVMRLMGMCAGIVAP